MIRYTSDRQLTLEGFSLPFGGKLNPENSKALLFVASQKTLPVSLAVLAGLHQETGNAVIVCLLFHFVQLFGDSILASRLRFQDKQTS